MSTLQDPTVQLVSSGQWAAVVTRLLRLRGAPTQVVPPSAAPASEAAVLVVWGAGTAAFSGGKVPAGAAMEVAANAIHNPNYPGQA